MPQGRRKTPFSGKAKKEQLKAKKQTKSFQNTPKKTILVQNSDGEEELNLVQKLNFQPVKDSRNTNRYVLQFHRETNAEVQKNKEEARKTLRCIPEEELEINGDDYFNDKLDFPKRPTWSFEMTKEELEAKEQKYFREYISNIERNFTTQELSYFEMNLETWRQLWRVLEMSDIVLFIVDVRFAGLMFPPSLYNYVSNDLKKDMILVLNKIDLAPAALVVAWKNYFQTKYPELHIVMFTTLPGYNLVGKQQDKAGLQVRKRKGRLRMAAEGTQLLYDTCKNIVRSQVDLTSWQQKIKDEMSKDFGDDESVEIGQTIECKSVDTSFFRHEKYKEGILTIGCLGQPNVGKSSVMNAIMGKKVVSVSRTPGHTKHFQTIFLTQKVRLCDCPGLVFPSKVLKVNQILMGSFPIAQVREPFSAVKYIAERLDLPKLLRMDHPEGDDTWSAMDICDGWAKKKGYFTAKAARLDTYRAANSLLRLALDGKICLCLLPLSFTKNKEMWEKHPDLKTVKWIQARSTNEDSDDNIGFISESSDEEDEQKTKFLGEGSQYKKDAAEGEVSEDDDDEESSDEGIATSNNFAALQMD